jgi:hypothetical protein
LLREAPDGRPWVSIGPDCRYGMRSMPGLVQDPNDPDDLDTSKDDHWADAFRYGAMSRPSPTRIVRDNAPKPGTWGFETAWQDQQATAAQMVIA